MKDPNSRSFRRRQGQATKAQKRALRELWPQWGLQWAHDDPIDIRVFGDAAETLWLSIGFGHGEALTELARRQPDDFFLGVEVHVPGIGATLLRLNDGDLDNVRLVRGDVVDLLGGHLQPVLFDAATIFFPDPFPDEADRRLVDDAFLSLLANWMRPGAELHIATDIEDYARHCLTYLEAHSDWSNAAEEFVERPLWRAETKYETAAIDAGRSIYDLRWVRADDTRSI